jgi:hypothetical protein
VTVLSKLLSIVEKRHQPPDQGGGGGNGETADQNDQENRHGLKLRKAPPRTMSVIGGPNTSYLQQTMANANMTKRALPGQSAFCQAN